ncbi:hypothetical protein J4207_05345 [Candidatus Woesearchaeota archaeon]|nr:hypothetical protein [Candidatus Woesearchaeota archaeon]
MLDKDKITQQAKKIMDNFMDALQKIEHKDIDFQVRREKNVRDDKATLNTNADFSERMLKNAPATKDNCILAEKKKW